ncbi:twin-arginine translocase TatA/TatE family subunit [Desulfothermobacter acidiphilus]|uniref:twin-arginine translocase TatA/TatE family subunit n=1 Tax=Desulfothermobacter acidiphilus TaxID=1938353 RepID=UPI003F8B542E
MLGLGAQEIILILAVALIVFGPGKLPELGRYLGKALREFRGATQFLAERVNGGVEEVKKEAEEIKRSIGV